MAGEGGGKRVKAQVLSGFRDHLPAQMILRRTLIERFRSIFEAHGFEPIDTPVLEHLDVLTGKAGENEKLMYHFRDHGDRAVGLRYDLTVPLARFVANHQNDLPMPFKRYHIAPVWRAERAQRGRFREFYQCDADIVGTASPQADAEALTIVAEVLEAAMLPNYVIKISHRRLLEGLANMAGVTSEQAPTVYRAVDKLDRIGAAGVLTELTDAGVETSASQRLLDLISQQGAPADLLRSLRNQAEGDQAAIEALDNLTAVFDLLDDLASDTSAFKLDLSLARGLDYYTGVVYEAAVEQPKVGSVSGGGRYDGLVGMFAGREIPAMGLSIGLERILEVTEEFHLISTPTSVCNAIIVFRDDVVTDAAQLATRLRGQGVNVDLSLLSGRSLGDQLKYADRRGIPWAIVLGADEIASSTATLKNLGSGDQQVVTQDSLAELILA